MMRGAFRCCCRGLYGLLVMLLVLASTGALGQWTTQNLALVPGWNPVFLTVEPHPAACDEMFRGDTRVLSVRRWVPLSDEDVIYDESEGKVLPKGGSWLTWFPTNHPDRALLDMAELAGNAAYLVEVSPGPLLYGAVQGHPIAVSHSWQAGVDHFVGMPVPFPPSVRFSDFFAAAGTAIPTAFHEGGEMYYVNADGSLGRIFQPAMTNIVAGHAYWIRAAERAEYAGPIGVTVDSPRRWIDFGTRLVPAYLDIRNATDAPRTVRMSHQQSGDPPSGEEAVAGPVPLRFAVVTPSERVFGRSYRALPATWTTQLQASATVRLALLPDVSLLTSPESDASYQSILSIEDDVEGAAMIRQQVGVRVATRSGTVTDAEGLWVGQVTITGVGRLEMIGLTGAIPSAPVPVARPFCFRMLVHVDTNGTARLLQRALVGTHTDSASGDVITQLLADESLVADYRSGHPDSEVFRVSAANFPLSAPVTLEGGMFGAPNQALRARVAMPRNHRVNPFLHAFAPMHDNREQRAEITVPYEEDVEVFSVNRHVELLFLPPDEASPDPRWGGTVCGGIYREGIYGLGGPLDASNRVIKVEGFFRLERAIAVGSLQQ